MPWPLSVCLLPSPFALCLLPLLPFACCPLPCAFCFWLFPFSFWLDGVGRPLSAAPKGPHTHAPSSAPLAQGRPWRGPCNPSIDMPTGFFPWAAQFLLDAEVQHFSLARWCGQATAPCPQRPTGLSTTAHPLAAPASADSMEQTKGSPPWANIEQISSAR